LGKRGHFSKVFKGIIVDYMDQEERLIGVVPVGEVPEIALKVIAAHISGYLNLDPQVLAPLVSPDYAFDQRRMQYDAGIILKTLESMTFSDFEKVVAVLNLDLFVPIFAHVFGEARQGGKFALVSLYRLGKNPEDLSSPSPLMYERAAKVALHELGHLFNLYHCERQRCLMHFSGGLESLDQTPLNLCRYCSADYKYYLSR
jgi:archaemetzincin